MYIREPKPFIWEFFDPMSLIDLLIFLAFDFAFFYLEGFQFLRIFEKHFFEL